MLCGTTVMSQYVHTKYSNTDTVQNRTVLNYTVQHLYNVVLDMFGKKLIILEFGITGAEINEFCNVASWIRYL